MAVGMRDPVLGAPTMAHLRTLIRDCPEALEVAEAGHFVQEHGEHIARAALASFELRDEVPANAERGSGSGATTLSVQ